MIRKVAAKDVRVGDELYCRANNSTTVVRSVESGKWTTTIAALGERREVSNDMMIEVYVGKA